jgi:hypothetical protein
MTSDVFVGLAACLEVFRDELRSLMNEKRNYLEGSPAAAECANEPFAAEWGAAPGQSVIGHAFLCANSCVDHLAAAAILIKSRSVTTSLYTVMRGASEAAAIASYILDPNIDARERVRRTINCRLDGLNEQIAMLKPFEDQPDMATVKAGLQGTVASIEKSSRTHGFTFHKANGYKAAYLDERLPTIMKLIDDCAGDVPQQGASHYRVMSGVAHAGAHGLTRLLVSGVVPGSGTVQTNVSAETMALDLFAGPLCASTVVEYLLPYLGWDPERMKPAVVGMLETWGRVCGVSAALPRLGPRAHEARSSWHA